MTSNIKRIEDLLAGDGEIASLPEIYYQLKEAIDDPDGKFEDIGKVINRDPGLSARLLKIANSPYYGLSGHVETISHALSMIGLSQLNDLVLSTLVIDKFKKIPVKLISVRAFWEHSLACGLAAKILAHHMGESNLERFFLASLLHDIGRLLLCIKAPEQMKEAISSSISRNVYIHTSEKSVFTFSHCDAGAALLKKWNLPEVYQEAAKFHHEPYRSGKYFQEVSVVHVAESIVTRNLYDCKGEPFIPPMDKSFLDNMGVNKEYLEKEVIRILVEQFNEIAGAFLQTV